MLTKTTELAFKALIFLGLHGDKVPVTPRRIAENAGTSPSYMAKVTSLLVKAAILRSHRGAQGGVTLNRLPAEITFLTVIEACQGQLVTGYCKETPLMESVCTFHHAMQEVHRATTAVLSRWTLEDMLNNYTPVTLDKGTSNCRMSVIIPGDDKNDELRSKHA